jgi:hypothetical protein
MRLLSAQLSPYGAGINVFLSDPHSVWPLSEKRGLHFSTSARNILRPYAILIPASILYSRIVNAINVKAVRGTNFYAGPGLSKNDAVTFFRQQTIPG